MPPTRTPSTVAGLTAVAMVAFAANSVLCRLALATGAMDPLGFTAVRLGAGAAVLWALTRQRTHTASAADWRRAGMLTLYALPFSIAYVALDTGTGALLLFGGVQITMLGLGLRAGERPTAYEWLALVGASAGVVYLVAPGVSAPSPLHAALMLLAGAGWGLYSLAGKGQGDPTTVVAAAFQRAAVVLVPVALAALPWLHAEPLGLLWATLSGAVTSGLGYAIWYLALRDLTATRAALVQLSVPALAAAGGVAILGESVSLRLIVASILTLGSIAVGVLGKR